MTDLRKSLKSEQIQSLKLRPPLTVNRSSSLKDVLAQMKEEKKGYAVVTDHKKVLGIFTERDILTRVIEQKTDLNVPIEKVMTANPRVLKTIDSVADAIRLMSEGSYRHIPLVDENENIMGLLGVRDLIQYLAEHYPYEVYNLPPDPQQVIRTPEGA
jgi:CBS domain-containing protein